jgi:hypothetical protein
MICHQGDCALLPTCGPAAAVGVGTTVVVGVAGMIAAVGILAFSLGNEVARRRWACDWTDSSSSSLLCLSCMNKFLPVIVAVVAQDHVGLLLMNFNAGTVIGRLWWAGEAILGLSMLFDLHVQRVLLIDFLFLWRIVVVSVLSSIVFRRLLLLLCIVFLARVSHLVHEWLFLHNSDRFVVVEVALLLVVVRVGIIGLLRVVALFF